MWQARRIRRYVGEGCFYQTHDGRQRGHELGFGPTKHAYHSSLDEQVPRWARLLRPLTQISPKTIPVAVQWWFCQTSPVVYWASAGTIGLRPSSLTRDEQNTFDLLLCDIDRVIPEDLLDRGGIPAETWRPAETLFSVEDFATTVRLTEGVIVRQVRRYGFPLLVIAEYLRVRFRFSVWWTVPGDGRKLCAWTGLYQEV